MTFDRLHRAITMATALVGLAVLWLSGELPAGVVAGAAAAMVAGPWTWRFGQGRRSTWAVNAVVVGAGAVAILAAFQTENYLYYAMLYVVFLAAARALMLRSAGDFMQAYVLSFLHVVSGAVVNPGLSFGLLMLPYVIGLTLSLMLTNVRRGIETQAASRAGAKVDARSAAEDTARIAAALARRDLVRPGFLWTTVAVTVAVFLMSVAFFFVFPRLGFGFFAQQRRSGIRMSGFSETVRLGDFGNIVEDPEVVLRVKAHAGGKPTPLRMRGQSLDEYDGRSWHRTTGVGHELPNDLDGRARADLSTVRLNVPDVRVQEVYLEPMAGSPRVLFGMPRPVAFQRPSSAFAALRPEKWRFFGDTHGDVAMSGPEAVAIVYTVYSDPHVDDTEPLRAAGTDYPPDVRRLYLQLPDPTDPRVAPLAAQVTASMATPYDRAVGIARYLKSDFQYSLDSTHGDVDPLADFLFVNRTGHCEYFASAMVVMLRSIGIPARIVNGFFGGEYNAYGEYVALRKADAHSWVEAFFPGRGWATFDPTPGAAQDLRADTSWLRTVNDAIDAAKLAWYRWVIEYNLEKQFQFFASLIGWHRSDADGFVDAPVGWKDVQQMAQRVRELPWANLGGGAALVLLGIPALVWVVRRRRRAGPRAVRPSGPAIAAYRRMKRVLRRAGFARRPPETQLEFARRVAAARPAVAADVENVTWTYLRALLIADAAADAADLRAAVDRVARGLVAEPR